ncbi:MAG: phospholipase A [Bacteroidales bacterium]|nr:phospholipase A [Bacteroidales bacterium]
MRKLVSILVFFAGLYAALLPARAQEPTSSGSRSPMLSIFKENYVTAGIPLNARPDWDTNDMTFQISIRYNAMQNIAGKDWNLFLGYTQLSVWDVFKPSNPFRSNIYMPGLYAYHPFRRDAYGVVNDLLLSLEHRSNGYDGATSRSIDCLAATYTHTFAGRFTAQVTGRFGIGSIYNDFSLEMFNRYQGYVNLGFCYHTPDRRFMATASVTPLFAGDIPANVQAEVAYRPDIGIAGAAGRDWFYIVARYHYGYDENQLDCAVPDVFLKHMVRFGLAVMPGRLSHKLCF